MTLELKVPKIACSACVNTVAKAVTTVDPTSQVKADTKTKIISIKTQKSEAEIKNAIASAGYSAA